MFENFKEFMIDTYNNMVINMYDAGHFEASNSADNIYDFHEEEILLADCWSNGKGGWWCSWNSDARLKENISDFSLESTDWLDNIRLRKYNYIGQDKEKIGVLAQELEEIMPIAAQTGKNGYMTIDLSQLLFMTIASLKELKDNVNKLEKENAELSGKLNKLTLKETN